MIIGIAASGRTLCHRRIRLCSFNRSAPGTISCNKGAEISKHADLPIEVDCGPEFLTGSTRLKSGTAQN